MEWFSGKCSDYRSHSFERLCDFERLKQCWCCAPIYSSVVCYSPAPVPVDLWGRSGAGGGGRTGGTGADLVGSSWGARFWRENSVGCHWPAALSLSWQDQRRKSSRNICLSLYPPAQSAGRRTPWKQREPSGASRGQRGALTEPHCLQLLWNTPEGAFILWVLLRLLLKMWEKRWF